jgi:hypothetical protein
MASTINASTAGGGGIISTADSSGVLQLQTAGTAAVTVDASQNVGIGTASPSSYGKLTVLNPDDVTNLITAGGTNLIRYIGYRASAAASVIEATNLAQSAYTPLFVNGSILQLGSGGSERMRIDSSGNVLVGATSPISPSKIWLQGDLVNLANGLGVNSTASSGTATFAYFLYNGTGVGTIRSTGSSTSYNTSSDYRLKEDISPMAGALNVVQQLKPVTYTWKSTGESSQGFIAHELAEVVPDCVTGEKDAVDADGNPQYQGIDTSFLVATLTAAIQELKAIVDTQAEQIKALEAK